jgi:Ni,Fe-hydrogenase I cytochrome b subunit
MDWIKIISAVMLVAMLFILYPSLKHATQNSPKGSRQDWMGAIKPLLFVVVFVVILILLVR